MALLQEEVRRLEADIDEKTEQNLQLLEEKIKVLRDLCAEAERRIALYNRELFFRDREEQIKTLLNPSDLSSTPAVSSYSPGALASKSRGKKTKGKNAGEAGRGTPESRRQGEPRDREPLLRGLEIRNEAAVSLAYRTQTGRREHPGPSPAVKESEISPGNIPHIVVSKDPVRPKPPPLKERIGELHRAGFSPELIAERLSITVGEVELYIAMGSG